jgi:hypothetical protein
MAKKEPYVSPQSQLQPPVVIHEHKPGATIKASVAAAAAHVVRVNRESKRKRK